MLKTILLTTTFLLLQANIASAHHAFAVDYDAGQIGTIEGKVVDVFYKNPHARYYVEVSGEDGKMETWDVQTMNLIMLSRIGWKKDSIKVGDKVVINGNLGRNDTKRINILTITEEDGNTFRPMGGPERTAALEENQGDRPTSIVAGIAPGSYELDANHGFLSFSYSHLGLSFPKLRFTRFDADLDLNNTAIQDSKIEVNIDASSLDTALPDLDKELKGDKFFDVSNYPHITFNTTLYEETSASTGKLTGNLTVKDITKPVTLDVKINAANESLMIRKDMIGFTATGTFSRSDFGMSMMTPMIGDEISVLIQTEFIKAD
jgi:polyisoprenoid-binding protein YceI